MNRNATAILQSVAGQRFPVETRFFVHERQPHETFIFLGDEQEDGQIDESQLDVEAGSLSNATSKLQRPEIAPVK